MIARLAIGFLAAIAHGTAIAEEVGNAAPAPAAIVAGAALTSNTDDPQPSLDLTPGTKTFPVEPDQPAFTLDDELILQLQVAGVDASDTIIGYGGRDGLYLPLGELARILDLAIRISDEGHYASGWFLDETRTVTVDLRQNQLHLLAGSRDLRPGEAQAFDGEMFLRSDTLEQILPIEIEPRLRSQSVLLTTLEPFPFQSRMQREADRARLGAGRDVGDEQRWPREETPWLKASIPMGDAELRAVADSAKGARLETDLRLAGDLAMMTAQAFFSASSRDGLIAALVQMGRRDADADLLGPLGATEFQVGDVGTTSMPVGLRGRAGRGAYVTNRAVESASIFEQIDLRGVLPNGYEVELYRNDILLGSVATAVNGQYEFLQIPVDYGLNVFRLVFYGPQGQRREEVRRISVGDGRLAAGDFEYDLGVIQRGVNLLGVEGPDFRPRDGYGNWQATGNLSYGISQDMTALAGIALIEDDASYSIQPTLGLRTSFNRMALRVDGAFSSGGGFALGAGVGTQIGSGSLTFAHFEYGGGFIDEVRNSAREPLSRATELTFNTTIKTGLPPIPLIGRARNVQFADGRTVRNAAVRGSMRVLGLLASNSFEYASTSTADGGGFSQLLGTFDLATIRRSSIQLRGSVGYKLLQGPGLSNVSGEVDYQLDDRTVVSGQASYAFNDGGVGVGVSAIREMERFTIALDGNYAMGSGSYSAALRVGFSFGRDPLRRKFYLDRPGQASLGAAAIRAFQDMDGDGVYGADDVLLKDVDFAVFNSVGRTDENGLARLTGLGNGNRVNIQVDPSSLPDIAMAPVNRGIEIVPRAGRFHVTDFPIVALSEVEGTVTFRDSETGRGVSGLRLQLVDEDGEVAAATRSERDGYFFFEQVKPGKLRLIVDPEQADRLGLCSSGKPQIEIGPRGDIYSAELEVSLCE